ncbi:MAG: hypothetical protein Greene041662_562 [Candidatus Peregrinibacteria bacterium Greene0416_62]|nr:MAG: hypothetical protein Greene041662_562 [Candidatus Peregrinibacteria bacterium Greene0416_62]TSC98585.1 MAG: hypothetical protein Greene101449_921 [Candidatus Peregrinibacteria bacterium Greene1014_49]
MAFDLAIVESIPGWLTQKESSLLYHLAKRCTGNGVIVEIGSWKGKSTVCLAQGSRDGAGVQVHAIDPFTGSSEHGDVFTFPEFQRNIAHSGIASLVTPHQKISKEAALGWTKPIELLWIDGAHEEEFVRLDYTLWSPHLVPGGVIAFHDSTDPGVWPIIDTYLFTGNSFRRIRFIDGITYAIKGKPIPGGNAIMMRVRDIKYALWKTRDTWRKRRRKKQSAHEFRQ